MNVSQIVKALPIRELVEASGELTADQLASAFDVLALTRGGLGPAD